MTNGNQVQQGNAGTQNNSPQQKQNTKKQPQPIEKIALYYVVSIVTDGYVIDFQLVLDTPDGKAKRVAPYEVHFKGKKKWFSGITDANGMSTKQKKVAYDPNVGAIEVMAKITGSAAKSFETIQLPAPEKIETKGSIISTSSGYSATVKVKVLTKTGAIRPHCPINWSGNKRSGCGTTDVDGNYSFTDKKVKKNQVSDEIIYKVTVGTKNEECKIKVPIWEKPQSKFSKEGNLSANWKVRKNRRESMKYVYRTLALFTAIFFIQLFAGPVVYYGICLLVGLFMYIKVDKDGTRGVWRPLIVTLIMLLSASSMPFVCVMIILTLPFYMLEELSKPINPDTKEPEKHPDNPYPKIPVLIGLFMTALCFALKVPDLEEPSRITVQNSIALTQGGLDLLKSASGSGVSFNKDGWMTILWNEFSSSLNWLIFSVILFLYKSPEEILEMVAPKTKMGDLTSLTGAFGFMKEAFQWLMKFMKK